MLISFVRSATISLPVRPAIHITDALDSWCSQLMRKARSGSLSRGVLELSHANHSDGMTLRAVLVCVPGYEGPPR